MHLVLSGGIQRCVSIPIEVLLGLLSPFKLQQGLTRARLLEHSDSMLDTISAHIQGQPPFLMMYAEDIALDENRLMLKCKINLWKGMLENGGLKLNMLKTKYMACGSPDSSTIHIGSKSAVKSEKFKYLGFVMHKSGDIK